MTIKVIKATIKLGDTELDVFHLPDGSYRYGYGFLASLMEKDKLVLKDKKSPFYLLKLLKSSKPMSEHDQIVLAVGMGQAYSYNSLSEHDLIECLYAINDLGFKKAKAFMKALALDALERRADRAFWLNRSEEERRFKLALRAKGHFTRRTLIESIQDYIQSHNVSKKYIKSIYRDCTDSINIHFLGGKDCLIKAILNIKSVRDTCNAKQLREIERVEDQISREIDDGGLEPLEATRFVLNTLRIRQLPLL